MVALLPLGDNNTTGRFTPWVSLSFILLCCLVFFVFELPLLGGEKILRFWQDFAFTPARLFGLEGKEANPHFPVWATLLTSALLHADFWHLFGNMLYFFIFGRTLEYAFGQIFFALFICTAAVFTAFVDGLSDIHSNIPHLGASGAISAVLGSYFILYPRSEIIVISPFFMIGHFTMNLSAFWLLGVGFLFDILGSMLDQSADLERVSFVAHIAGFVLGLLLGKILRRNYCSYDYIHGSQK
ncbi:MAG: rhomboid family intramembrane serine protease [Rhodospirillales bacterium]|nr:rhomboid family intramembrane serine protease [Rhodospirillales bacterium]